MFQLAFRSLADSTRENYRRTWYKIREYIKTKPELSFIIPLPVDVICLFITYVFRCGNAHSTITGHVSAISYVHKILNLKDSTAHPMVGCLLNAVKKEAPNQLKSG